MRTIIAGSREASWDQVVAAIDQCPWKAQISLVVSGTAKGADYFGEVWANTHNVPIQRFPADWNKYGKRAGVVRNSLMADNADALIAIWVNESSGTKNMIETAKKKGLTAHIIAVSQEGVS